MLLSNLVISLWKTSVSFRKTPPSLRFTINEAESFLISGGFAGLAGMMEVCGVITRLTQKISPGYGFIGIAAALLGRLNPVGAFFAALLFAAVMNGAKTMSIVVGGASIAMVPVIQGVVVLIVLAAEVIARWRQ